MFVCPVLSGCNAAMSESNGDSQSIERIYKLVQDLVLRFYPKCKFVSAQNSLSFEYKTRKQIGYYSSRLTEAPDEGGIEGNLSLHAGEYSGDDKDRLPSEVNDGFSTTLRMAPYSQASKSHLLAVLIFPPETNEEFKLGFKQLVASFCATSEASPSNQKTSTPPSDIATTGSGVPPSTDTAKKSDFAPAQSRQSLNQVSAEAGSTEKPLNVPPVRPTTTSATTAKADIVSKPPDLSPPQMPPTGLHLFTASGGAMGGKPVSMQSSPKATPQAPSKAGYPASAFVFLKPIRWVPGYPTKVVITHSTGGHGSTSAYDGSSIWFEISYFTPEPYKKVFDTWIHLLQKSGWVPLGMEPGKLKATISIPMYHPDGSQYEFGAGNDARAAIAISYQPVSGCGTNVVVRYDEQGNQASM